MDTFACIKNGLVENIIAAEEGFISHFRETHGAEFDDVVKVEPVTVVGTAVKDADFEDPNVVPETYEITYEIMPGIGWLYADGKFSRGDA